MKTTFKVKHRSSKPTAIDLELKVIQEKHGGIISPAHVVAFAKNPKTALHSQFTWDNTIAGREYRLWQARQLIRVRVHFEPLIEKRIRTFVSLPSDRKDGRAIALWIA